MLEHDKLSKQGSFRGNSTPRLSVIEEEIKVNSPDKASPRKRGTEDLRVLIEPK
jgi:hypothetical protein